MGRVERSEPWTCNPMSRVAVFMFSLGLVTLKVTVDLAANVRHFPHSNSLF